MQSNHESKHIEIYKSWRGRQNIAPKSDSQKCKVVTKYSPKALRQKAKQLPLFSQTIQRITSNSKKACSHIYAWTH